MAKRHIHYEAAFEDYLRSRGWPYIPIDEQRRATLAEARVKSFDYVVYPPGRAAWLCDVKGRKFPYDGKGGRRYWENWVTRDDLDGLDRWQEVFGQGFEPMIVFAYWLGEQSVGAIDHLEVHVHGARRYAFLLAPLAPYQAHSRVRSPKWDTVAVPTRAFRELALTIRA